ncbi:hypothetical protein [Streptomyces formicae]|uniref:Uncharacterized protein n=1 Tax=Streptomyces formicae TaxID=1616117 RepID=A0ABY3WPD3_9ACTN|nr:hypothetical protein [Streptomyces formicae]UNM13177.1 hypothetical protein J4032_18255 [Streptomyces formicae]
MQVTYYEGAACLLAYSYRGSINYIAAGGTVSIDLTVQNKQSTDVVCEKIVYTIPVGSGTVDLAVDKPSSVTAGGNWSCTGSLSGDKKSYVITAVPKPGKNTLKGRGMSETVATVSGVRINDKSGDAVVRVEASTAPARQEGFDLVITKFPSGFKFDYFHPQSISVPAGQPVVLAWSGKNVEEYSLTYGAGGELQRVPIGGDATECKVAGLEHRTAFALQAHVKTDDRLDLYPTLTTMVDVKPADSSWNVRDVICNGTAQLGNLRGLKSQSLVVDLYFRKDNIEQFAKDGLQITTNGEGILSFTQEPAGSFAELTVSHGGVAPHYTGSKLHGLAPAEYSGDSTPAWLRSPIFPGDSIFVIAREGEVVNLKPTAEFADQVKTSTSKSNRRVSVLWCGFGTASSLKEVSFPSVLQKTNNETNYTTTPSLESLRSGG